MINRVLRWLLNDPSIYESLAKERQHDVDTARLLMFILFHFSCLLVITVGFSWTALFVMIILYVARMFFITAFYHRYFSHRTYHVSRVTQFIMAVLGSTSGQRGPLWWAAHHRLHHLSPDTENDPHSPRNGFINSHFLWFLRRKNFLTDQGRIKDWIKYPELVIFEKYDWVPFLLLSVVCFSFGEYLALNNPQLGTDGMQLLVWGFIISTVLLYHGTYTINSLAHQFGKRRFNTQDDSKNNFLLALITLGEGWHNNHHRYPGSVKQGFYRSEIDISYWGIRLMAALGLARHMRNVPEHVLTEGMIRKL